MEICQGILNGEMITPSYSQLEARDQGPPVEPEQEKEVRKEVVQEPEPPAPPAQHVTPYMNSAALNEIAGELLITVRELREELLQVCRRKRFIGRTKINCSSVSGAGSKRKVRTRSDATTRIVIGISAGSCETSDLLQWSGHTTFG